MRGVRVRFLNAKSITKTLKERAERLLQEDPNILEISLFGSLVKGNYVPGSDADIFILLKRDERRLIDRVPDFLDALRGVEVPLEVFPYTMEEVENMKEEGFMKTILKEKVLLAKRG